MLTAYEAGNSLSGLNLRDLLENINTVKRIIIAFAGILLFFPAVLKSQADPGTYRAFVRQDYYTNEEQGEIYFLAPASKNGKTLKVDLVLDHEFLLRGFEVFPGEGVPVPFSLGRFKEGENEITLSVYENEMWVESFKLQLVLRPHLPNAVKIDRATGGLIADSLPFFPFGFYASWPVDLPSLNEEAARGFNLISPYWKAGAGNRREKMEFMDRCAELGFKVNFNVCSVAGGGGVAGSHGEGLSADEKLRLLREEVTAFRYHPALLAWYISDEPIGQGVPPGALQATYKTIKELDPYHPVTIVFMTPSGADAYAGVMDIAMTDPYPIPNNPVTEVSDFTDALVRHFRYDKPVWTVPQAFGGNEWWSREPLPGEVRAMTYLAVIHHATGIQYFIRRAPNGTPKAAATWGECGGLSLEMAELAPDLFSGLPAPQLSCSQPTVHARVINKHGRITVMAVNTSADPVSCSFRLESLPVTGKISVLYENRELEMNLGSFEDMIEGHGTRLYRIDISLKTDQVRGLKKGNLTLDPGFEENAIPGVPSACYASVLEQNGSTFFVDSRIAVEGNHSLRLNNTGRSSSLELSFFGPELSAETSYTLSVRARTGPSSNKPAKRGFISKKEVPVSMSLSLAEGPPAEFALTSGWKEYSINGQKALPGVPTHRNSPHLGLTTKGTAWIDLVQLVPDLEILSVPIGAEGSIMTMVSTIHQDAVIHYTLDGTWPTPASAVYEDPIFLKSSVRFRASAFSGNELKGFTGRDFTFHDAIGDRVRYDKPYSLYLAGGDLGLVDGILGTEHYRDGKWQGFEGNDMRIVIDLGEEKEVGSVRIRFLEDQFVWIFLPEIILVQGSLDGATYFPIGREDPGIPKPSDEKKVSEYTLSPEKPMKCRYIQVFAGNTATCPEWHKGAGGKCWIFVDEVIVNDQASGSD